MPDTASDIQNRIRETLTNTQVDRVHTYAVLLGRRVIDTMNKTLGDDGSVKFLEALEAFGRALDNTKTIDVLTLIPVNQIMAFQDFEQYVNLLTMVQQRLVLMKQDDLKPLVDAANAVLDAAKPQQASEPNQAEEPEPAAPAEDGETQATAAARKPKNPVFTSTRFRGLSLPSVPMSYLDRENLPKTFPDYTNIRGVVVARFNKSDIRTKLYRDLSSCLAKTLKAVTLHRKLTEQVTTDPRDYIAEAQQYLMDHNWIGYGLDEKQLVAASDRLDKAGVPNMVDFTDGVLVVAAERTSAYAFLGVNLESILRKTIQDLANDVRSNYNFEGKQSALAVIIAACSSVIQEAAQLWLENVQDAFNKNAAGAV
jgi:hypothetical protein